MGRRGRGEGSYRETSTGQWQAIASGGFDAAGKRVRPSKTCGTKREALAWLREVHQEITGGTLPRSGTTTLADYLRGWLASTATALDPSTQRTYLRQLGHLLPHCGAVTLAKTRPHDIEQLIAAARAAGCPAYTAGKALAVLKSSLADAVQSGILGKNPAAGVRRPKSDPRPIRPLSAEQARHFLGVAREHRRFALFCLALDAGMRQGELLGLHWPDVDLDAATLRVVQSLDEDMTLRGPARHDRFRLKPPKSARSRRTISLAPGTIQALRELWGRSGCPKTGLVFRPCRSRARTPYVSKHAISTQLQKLLDQAGLPPMPFHGLRHTSATLLLRAGVNVRVVSERLGHQDVGTTLRVYAHVLSDDPALAAASVQAGLYG
jgi:integrase